VTKSEGQTHTAVHASRQGCLQGQPWVRNGETLLQTSCSAQQQRINNKLISCKTTQQKDFCNHLN
jgi:hypothetical protein